MFEYNTNKELSGEPNRSQVFAIMAAVYASCSFEIEDSQEPYIDLPVIPLPLPDDIQIIDGVEDQVSVSRRNVTVYEL
jgi:hypothetical protein